MLRDLYDIASGSSLRERERERKKKREREREKKKKRERERLIDCIVPCHMSRITWLHVRAPSREVLLANVLLFVEGLD